MSQIRFSRARRAASICVLLLGLGVCAPMAATTPVGPTPDPVKDCPLGLVCFTIKEQAQIDRQLAEYERMKAKKRLLAWHFGCGPGIGGVIDTELRARALPVPAFCGAIFGF